MILNVSITDNYPIRSKYFTTNASISGQRNKDNAGTHLFFVILYPLFLFIIIMAIWIHCLCNYYFLSLTAELLVLCGRVCTGAAWWCTTSQSTETESLLCCTKNRTRIHINTYFSWNNFFTAAEILTACEGVGVGCAWAGTKLLLWEAANSVTWLTEELLTAESWLAETTLA